MRLQAGCSALYLSMFSPSCSAAIQSLLWEHGAGLSLNVELLQIQELMQNYDAIEASLRVHAQLAQFVRCV